MKRTLTIAALAASLTLTFTKAQAQSVELDYFLPDTCNYNPAIPTPASVLGFELGELMVSPEKGAEYIKEVVAASDRMTLIRTDGPTKEGLCTLSLCQVPRTSGIWIP